MSDKKKSSSSEDDILAESKDMFETCNDAENFNRINYNDDMRFYQGGEYQWDEASLAARRREGRPALTINKIPAFCRQVTNDARQNKPSIKVHPADSAADVETAEIIQELIRNIEVTSDADVAYDTGSENAVRGGWGYFKVDLDQTYNDTADLDIKIKRVANTLSIYGDPFSTQADSSDWNDAFEVEWLPKKQFDREYGEQAAVDWSSDVWNTLNADWITAEMVLLAHRWKRTPTTKDVVILSDGTTQSMEKMDEVDKETGLPYGQLWEMIGNTVVRKAKVRSYNVMRYTMTGAEVLDEHKWPGCYIPIVPVYGNEIWVEGKRYLTSLFHDAKDAQMNFNYWRSASTELVALAPKTPFIGEEGAFDADIDKWATANTRSHAFLEFSAGKQPPQRQPFVGVPAGVLQEAANTSDDMKSIMGLFDASLGAKSNETSGKAIMARQREGDVSTFNFQDNVSRAIRHLGRIIIDLIPSVYQGERMIRVMGEDNKARNIQLGKPTPVLDKKTGEQQPDPQNPGMPLTRIYDLTAGKYDLTVETGPSFTTRREEAAEGMTALIQAYPPAAPVIGPALVKALDWPGASDIAEGLEELSKGGPPELQKQMADMQQELQQTKAENEKLTSENLLNKTKAGLAEYKLQAKDVGAPVDQPHPLELEIEQIKLETAKESALAAYYTANSKLADVLNPPLPEAPDPFAGVTAEAGHLKAQADHLQAQAALHSAQNPPTESPDPHAGTLAEADSTTAQAKLISAKAQLHAAKNPPPKPKAK